MTNRTDDDGLADKIAKTIAEQIINGELVEGERIQELRIAKELGVSRGSVREALLLLERTFLIEIFPRRGAMVSELSAHQVKALFTSLTILLEYMAHHCSETWRQAESERIQQLNVLLVGQLKHGQSEQFFDAIFEFFTWYSHRMQNPYLSHMYADLLPSVRRSYFLTLHMSKRDLDDAAEHFKLLIDAILLRKPMQAARFAAEFCQHICRMVLDSLARMKQIEMAWAQRSRR